MYHSLKTLHQWAGKHYPALLDKFSDLSTYCQSENRETNLNQGYNSLKWLVYTLRNEISSREVEDVFFYCLAEALFRKESYLYNSIRDARIVGKYSRYLKKKTINESEYELREINGWVIAVHNTGKNLTNVIFQQTTADLIIATTPAKRWAAIVIRQDSLLLDQTDILQGIFPANCPPRS